MKRYFFHAETKKYQARFKHILLIVTVPILAVCVFCAVNMLINIGREIFILYCVIAAGCVALGIVVSFGAAYFTRKLAKRHAKYTYFDVLPTAMVFSEYAGEFSRYGEQIILRRLYYIPFDKLEEVSRNAKETPRFLTFKGEIREYLFRSDRLGYHITDDGEIVFDSFELNFARFRLLKKFVLKDRFGSTKRLESSVNFYWEKFKNIPEKPPFDITKYVHTVKKKKPVTSNPLLEEELPSFNRNWK